MLLLIDAYNLLHQSDVLHRGRGDRWLEKARQRLIHRLAEHLDPELAAQTCLVFDASKPPRGRSSEFVQLRIQIRFAVDHREADDLLEEIITRHATPKRLTVISSDHRIQRAASRRGATFFDADVWYADLLERGPRLAIPWPPRRAPTGSPTGLPAELSGAAGDIQTNTSLPGHEKPQPPTDQEELQQWLEWFAEPTARRDSKRPAAPRKVAKKIGDKPLVSAQPKLTPAASNQPPATQSPAKKPPAKKPPAKKPPAKKPPAKKPPAKKPPAKKPPAKKPPAKKPPAKKPPAKKPPAKKPVTKNKSAKKHPAAPASLTPTAGANRKASRDVGRDLKRGAGGRPASGPNHQLDANLANPFPEGYGEDLLDGE
ncbi:NYN domain-containing protein [Planctomycetaceae bacterium SH139]